MAQGTNEYHGWRGPGGALYIAVDTVTGNPTLFSMDVQGDYEPLAEFLGRDQALAAQRWMDDTIAASGEANRMLIEQLEDARTDPEGWPA